MRSVRVPAQALAWDRLTDGGFNSESLSLSLCLGLSLCLPHTQIHPTFLNSLNGCHKETASMS